VTAEERAQRELAEGLTCGACDRCRKFGVPQLRRRVIITATLSGAPCARAPSSAPTPLGRILEIIVLSKALPEVPAKARAGIARAVRQGQKL
jgi:hypothetical protein